MTECKKMKKMMVEAIPNDLTEDERRRFHKHLKICAGCAKEYKKLTELMGVMNKRHRPQMSQAFWDNYTNRLDEKMVTATEKREPVVRKCNPLALTVESRWCLRRSRLPSRCADNVPRHTRR